MGLGADFRSIPVTDAKCEWLKANAFGHVLEFGYGTGKSARAMASSEHVLSVTSWEPIDILRPFIPPNKVTVIGGEAPTVGNFDFVFIDCFQADRDELAKIWQTKVSVVVIDDREGPLGMEVINGAKIHSRN